MVVVHELYVLYINLIFGVEHFHVDLLIDLFIK
jgi:hypothetical protein